MGSSGSEAPRIEQRTLAGTSRTLSAIAISVDPPPAAAPAADARAVALLQRARALGVTTFDIADARSAERAERLISRAFPSADPQLWVIVGRSLESLARERTRLGDLLPSSDLGIALRASLEESARRLGNVEIGLVDWDPSPNEDHREDRVDPPVDPFAGAPAGVLWATRVSPSVEVLPTAVPSPRLFSGPLSLLQPNLAAPFEASGDVTMGQLIARDPFASGRLDGSRFASRVALSGPADTPVDVRRLHEEFDPVLRLGFLTEERRRTLAQAALQFVLRWPWVLCVVVPLPEPERFDEVLGFGSRPPLSEEELARLGLLK